MKNFLLLLLSILVIVTISGCGTTTADNLQADGENNGAESGLNNEDSSVNEDTTFEDENDANVNQIVKLVVGATSVPHAEVLEKTAPLLLKQGIELEIEVYQDYILPNKDLKEGRIDANYFQHIPYLQQQNAEFNYGFVNAGGIHIEPMGIYSKSIKRIGDIPAKTEVIMSRSIADHGRILSLLEREGIITLKEGINKVEATVDDVIENPLALNFTDDIDAGLLPQFYKREENALVAINTNYAIEAGLNPANDALILEGAESPYVNVIAVNKGFETSEAIATLVNALRSEEIQTFIKEKYKGSVVPVSN